ncbi:murein hydrolase activator EnvC family protein [Immundisolibacter cernigliae]|uniref:murein hydrolase activator EnvC family protein n=1 Tax=Immundisolibacter cernigliae TaxID=1810504 RepID=UPI0011AB5D9E|nr:peptidoglycan DD-metalloendopeptidase family protein [Immundisolibacter cernigliae]
MPPLSKPLSAIGLCVLALLAGTAPVAADDAAQAKSRLERLGDELGQVLGTLRQRLVERDSLRSRLAEADRQVAQVNTRLIETERRSAALQRNLDELRAQQAQARARLDVQRQALARSLALAARSGNADRLKLLLNQQDPAALTRQLRYQRAVADAQAARLGDLRRQLDAFQERDAQIAADVAALADQQGDLQQQRTKLAALREERKSLLARAESDVNRGEQRVRAIEQDQRELKDLLTGIARREARAREREQQAQAAVEKAPKAPAGAPSARLPPAGKSPDSAGPPVSATPTPSLPGERFSARRSRLPWPISGQLKARFGTTRESGRTRWDGVVIAARPGSTVRSIHAGKVVYADVLGGYGLLVIVDHGEGYLSLYGYNDAILKRPGQRVAAGEPIASVGDRGNASGVYFEIRHRGRPVNPSAWCGG